jgi:hypothetical protein
VRAQNAAGSSAWSNSDTAVLSDQQGPPAAPSGLNAVPVSSSRIDLTWADSSDSEDGFRVERSLSATSGFAQIASVGADATSYSSTGLSADTTYYYRVRTYNSAGNSGYSNTASATTAQVAPAAPSGLNAASVSASQIDLVWADNSDNESGFKVQRSLSATSGFAQIVTVGASATSYSDSGLAADTTYYYRVNAYNSAGNSGYSNTASAITTQVAPAAPSGLNAASASSSQIDLTWADNSDNEDGFRVERSLSAASGFAQIASVGANATSYSNAGLSTDTTYYYRVRAYNSAGNSAYSNTTSATTAQAGPAAPSGLTATAVSSSALGLTWADGSDNESGFKVERSLHGTSPFTEIASVGANVTSYSDSGLEPDTAYGYRVRAYNEVGNSGYSNTAVTNTHGVPPAAPSGLTATAASSSRIDLAWVDVGTYEDTGLSGSTTYYYRVTAHNAAGDSGGSNTASATTQTPTSVPVAGARDVVTDGSYAYLASDLYGVIVVDVEDPANPMGIGSVEVGFIPVRLDGNADHLVAVGGKIAVVDASNPYQPTLVSTLDTSSAREVAVAGDIAYVVDSAGYLLVIDLSQPADPVVVAELPVGGSPKEIAVVNGYAYIAAGSALIIVDVKAPSSPYVVSSLVTPCQLVAARDGYAYVDGMQWGGVQVVDVSAPSTPTIVGQHQTGSRLIRFVEDNAYVYAVSGQLFGPQTDLLIIDAAEPASILTTASAATAGTAWGIAADGPYAYVADGSEGLAIFDISDPYDPILVGTAQ